MNKKTGRVKSAARTRALAKANDRAIWRKQQDLEVPGFVTLKGALAMLGGNVTLFALRARVTRGVAAGTITVAKHDGGKVYFPLAVIEEWRLHPPKRGPKRRTHCIHGHSLDDAYLNQDGTRTCRECTRLKWLAKKTASASARAANSTAAASAKSSATE
ncbi:MAG TPA: hypothetical protein VJX68_05745 [Candidatus Binatus sp.]|uniref:hypothetical protein n=1 Tax=Candidatus Binatus sp. TaxID=2811406 RepID=UPI002B498F39|nr:hypothetical protein [Candidatus Binatus sp.]HKN12681.1 hypothetical protein [Candidatus Binatus sp.]